jgi:hypothetical protein
VVTVIQRFDAALALIAHFHSLVLRVHAAELAQRPVRTHVLERAWSC